MDGRVPRLGRQGGSDASARRACQRGLALDPRRARDRRAARRLPGDDLLAPQGVDRLGRSPGHDPLPGDVRGCAFAGDGRCLPHRPRAARHVRRRRRARVRSSLRLHGGRCELAVGRRRGSHRVLRPAGARQRRARSCRPHGHATARRWRRARCGRPAPPPRRGGRPSARDSRTDRLSLRRRRRTRPRSWREGRCGRPGLRTSANPARSSISTKLVPEVQVDGQRAVFLDVSSTPSRQRSAWITSVTRCSSGSRSTTRPRNVYSAPSDARRRSRGGGSVLGQRTAAFARPVPPLLRVGVGHLDVEEQGPVGLERPRGGAASASTSCARVLPSPNAPQTTTVLYVRGRSSSCMACTNSVGVEPFAGSLHATVLDHVRRDVAPVDVEAGAEAGNQHAAGAAGDVERRLRRTARSASGSTRSRAGGSRR